MGTGTVVRADPCKSCKSDDTFHDVRWETINGIELRVKKTYCNLCGYREHTITLIPEKGPEREIFHDIKQEQTYHIVEQAPVLGVMKETTRQMLEVGYTDEQAKLIGNIDYMFEEAIRLGLCTGDEALAIGRSTGMVFGKHTGKLL